ncbi:response regulator transcription factor [Methylomonas albis]|uniref:Response regulator transcription factor n=1 Tax=Methylomonas albis TaxID=1854563 RepID=A0ABR9D049_9GAMM|nr:response regulator [Methylomonas albis]MBD9356504.1 response regulator transcription factor [Methylomonas albis]
MSEEALVFIVDDDDAVRDSLGQLMQAAGLPCQLFESAEDFLEAYRPGQPGCLVLDLNMPDMSGDELQNELIRLNIQIPIIFLTAFGDIPTTVRVIKAGAIDFLTKPIPSKVLLTRIEAVLQQQSLVLEQNKCNCIITLTARELEVMYLVITGQSNKQIARHLGISHRTVEVHRARVMEKTGASNLVDLVRICSEYEISCNSVN